MSDPQASLKELEPKYDYLIAIDSDGCVFDSMEIKQKECFIPNNIKHWNLQAVSKYARAASEFVNLYSKWRGANRFPVLVKIFDLLREWPEVLKRNVEIPQANSLRAWIKAATPSTRVRSMAPEKKARAVNSPGSALRAPRFVSVSRTTARSGGAPSRCSSTTSWRV